jgi:hypothetical protein
VRPSSAGERRQDLDDRALAEHYRVLVGLAHLLATTVLRASRRVTASRDSSAIPAASFAAAQYLMVILTMCDILTSTGPRALLPPGPVLFIQGTNGVHRASKTGGGIG